MTADCADDTFLQSTFRLLMRTIADDVQESLPALIHGRARHDELGEMPRQAVARHWDNCIFGCDGRVIPVNPKLVMRAVNRA